MKISASGIFLRASSNAFREKALQNILLLLPRLQVIAATVIMKYEVYNELSISDDYSIFDFVSVGQYGNIPKRVEFMPTEILNISNLAFGDISEDGEIDDYSISDNGDRNKNLATIAFAVEIYLNKFPGHRVYFKGSTQERTRLYRMALGINFEELSLKFKVYAEQRDGIVPFQKNIDIIGSLVNKIE